MTKNKTKKNLTWKLKDLPTASELADLVRADVIKPDEAREIVFGSAENDKEKIKALEELIEFLQDLTKELSKNRTTTFIPWSRTVYIDGSQPYWDKYWMRTEKILCDAGLSVGKSDLTVASGVNSLKLNGSGNAIKSKPLYSGDVAQLGGSMAVDNTHRQAMTMTVSYNDKNSIS